MELFGKNSWVMYLVVAYPAIAYEAYTDPSYTQHATMETVQDDAIRVLSCVAAWASVFIGLRVVPDAVLPAWFVATRRAPEGRFDTIHKPVNMLVSLLHSIIAVGVGCYLVLPTLWAGEWQWIAPMNNEHRWFISMFQGYQIADTSLGWAGQSPMHRIHHLAGLLAWGFPLFSRSECTIVSVAYLLAEIANPFMHQRWCLKYWKKDKTLYGKINEALCVTTWILVRNIPELYVCYHHAWFDTRLPLTWRLTVATGNMLTVIWTTQIFQLLQKMAKGEKGHDPMDNPKKEKKDKTKTASPRSRPVSRSPSSSSPRTGKTD